MGRLGVQWKGYETNVMSSDAGDIQRKCTKRAFYAGADALVSILSDTSTPSEEIVISVIEELDEFVKDVEQGKA